VPVSVRLHPTNIRAIQHAFGPICYDTASRQPSAVTEGLPDTRSGGGPYEVSAIRTGCWLVNVCYGRDAARHSIRGGHRKQIHAQSRPPSLECSEAYLPLSGVMNRLKNKLSNRTNSRIDSVKNRLRNTRNNMFYLIENIRYRYRVWSTTCVEPEWFYKNE
jgi:hypothetical protein